MRGGATALVLALATLVAAASGAAATGPPVHVPGSTTPMTVVESSSAAGARRVQLAVTLRYEMQCAYPGAGPLSVTFPAAFTLPSSFAKGTVLLAGKPVAAKVANTTVTVTVPSHHGVMCDLMGPGSVVVTFTHAAGLANPASPGTYRFTAVHARRGFSTTLKISP